MTLSVYARPGRPQRSACKHLLAARRCCQRRESAQSKQPWCWSYPSAIHQSRGLQCHPRRIVCQQMLPCLVPFDVGNEEPPRRQGPWRASARIAARQPTHCKAFRRSTPPLCRERLAHGSLLLVIAGARTCQLFRCKPTKTRRPLLSAARYRLPSRVPKSSPGVTTMPRAFWTTRDVATRANVCCHTIRRWVKRRLLPVVRISPRHFRFEPAAVERFLAKRSTSALSAA
jgi:hypothetical protein